MKVIILCGGTGTRLKEETEYRPKAMVEISDKDIFQTLLIFVGKNGFLKNSSRFHLVVMVQG